MDPGLPTRPGLLHPAPDLKMVAFQNFEGSKVGCESS